MDGLDHALPPRRVSDFGHHGLHFLRAGAACGDPGVNGGRASGARGAFQVPRVSRLDGEDRSCCIKDLVFQVALMGKLVSDARDICLSGRLQS